MAVDYRFQPKGLKSNLGWYDRGYIPHFEGGEIAQFLTYRLADSMPANVLDRWRKELDSGSEADDTRFRKRVELYLDRGHGECWLRDPRIAELVEDNLLFHDGKKYDLKSWVVMPNHVHVLLTPLKDVELGSIAHSLKSYVAHRANRILGRQGRFWQPEVFDRYIRNQRHFANVIRYIERNPVKAHLCHEPSDWRYSSAYWKKLAK
ncbi:MAG: transposase [Acidobacteriota bacterium]|nr:MAG: transposase [Acidobacteriota bacterium]